MKITIKVQDGQGMLPEEYSNRIAGDSAHVQGEEEHTSRCNSESRLSYVSSLTMLCSEFTHSLTGYESGPSGRNVAVYGRE